MNFDAIQQALTNAVGAVNNLAQTMKAVFPLASSSVVNTATGGAQTLPANPAGFLTITVNGTSYKVPLYNP